GYVVTGLSNGTTYAFTVAATNSWGSGLPSAASNAATPGTVPGIPGTPSPTAGNAQVSLSWTAPSSNGGASISSYHIVPYIGSTAHTVPATRTTTPSYAVTGLTNGTTYAFTVAAANTWGTGSASATSNASTPGTVPGIPGTPSAAAGNAQVSLSWTAP